MDLLRTQTSNALLSAIRSSGVSQNTKGALVVDAQLSGVLSLAVDGAGLRSAGVEKVIALDDISSLAIGSTSRVIVVLRSRLDVTAVLVKWLVSVKANLTNPVHVLVVPRRSLVCERVFAESHVSECVVVKALAMDTVILDDDSISLELDDACFRDLFLHRDPSCLYSAAKALMKIQALHGIIPKILGKGSNAQILANIMLRMRRELDASSHAAGDIAVSPFSVFPPKMDIDSIIILDRTVDLVTPLCMQLTYEGLVDEVFGIKTTFVQVNESLITNSTTQSATSSAAPQQAKTAPQATKTKKVSLNPSMDKLFVQLRDLNFAVVGTTLNQHARKIQEEVDSRHDAKTISQIKDFIGKLGGLEGDKAYLKLHTSLAEDITKQIQTVHFNKFLEIQQNIISGTQSPLQLDYMEEMIDKQAPILQTLRFMALYSVVCGGIKPKNWDILRREFVQTYGIQHLLTLQNLEAVGLLSSSSGTLNASFGGTLDSTPLLATAVANAAAAAAAGGGLVGTTSSTSNAAAKASFANLRKPLGIIVEDVDEQNPTDVAYVHSGYAPVSIRLVEAAAGCGKFATSGPGAGVSTGIVRGGGPRVSMSLDGLNLGSSQAKNAATNRSERGKKVTWQGLEDVLQGVPGGPHFELDQALPDPHFIMRNDKEKKTTIVLFLGGCTSAEISALRFLSKGRGRKFIAMTTSIITGTRLINSLVEDVEKRPLTAS
ncbi:Sec1-like protein [Obelidium mucronatum]|nr:Sec1-like protein [Obelidium mucronatum]